jgi:hypothetical protein
MLWRNFTMQESHPLRFDPTHLQPPEFEVGLVGQPALDLEQRESITLPAKYVFKLWVGNNSHCYTPRLFQVKIDVDGDGGRARYITCVEGLKPGQRVEVDEKFVFLPHGEAFTPGQVPVRKHFFVQVFAGNTAVGLLRLAVMMSE